MVDTNKAKQLLDNAKASMTELQNKKAEVKASITVCEQQGSAIVKELKDKYNIDAKDLSKTISELESSIGTMLLAVQDFLTKVRTYGQSN